MSILTLPLRIAAKALAAIKPSSSAPAATPAAAEPAAHKPSSAAPAASSNGRRGKYDQQLTELVAAEPGITVAQAAQRINVHPTALYPVLKRLEARGQLIEQGRGLHATG